MLRSTRRKVNLSATTGCWGEDSNRHQNRREAPKADAPVRFYIPEIKMKRLLIIIVLLLATVSAGQNKQESISEIEFYGYAGLDLDKIRGALPIREGDNFVASPGALFDLNRRVRETVKQLTGHEPTDIETVCCNAQGNWMLYVGLSGNSIRLVPYNPLPQGKLALPPEIVNLYQQTMDALMNAVRSGGAEDRSQGYSLSTDATLRAKQLATRKYALRHERLIRRVLKFSADARQRIVAAHVLGYARRSDEQIAALVRAGRDADETVRNNAIRALAVLAESATQAAERIPAAGFIEMLNSGSWSDRNKAGLLLEKLSVRREPKLLGQLRAQALESLLEMARWRNYGHAYSSRFMVGRIAGIEEKRLQQLAQTGQVQQIIGALRNR